MISEQPGLLADVLRPQPVMDHGHMNGFRVYPGRNRQAFMRLGLRPGDQVTAINGTPLDDRDRGEQILRTLGSSSEARVTVIRDGQQQDLTLNLAQVEQEADSLATQSPAAQTAGRTRRRRSRRPHRRRTAGRRARRPVTAAGASGGNRRDDWPSFSWRVRAGGRWPPRSRCARRSSRHRQPAQPPARNRSASPPTSRTRTSRRSPKR